MTEDELLAEIIAAIQGSAPENEPGTVTTVEVATRLGCSHKKAVDQLKNLSAQGKVKPDRVRRVNFWGVATSVPGWRLIEVSEPNL